MGSLNRVQLIGNVGKDPETKYLTDGTPVVNLTVATNEEWKDKATGERQSHTEWHRISFFGKTAEIAGQYLRKGKQVFIEGSIRSREYTDKDGQKRTSYEIRGDRMVMLGKKEEGDEAPAQSHAPATRPASEQRRPAGSAHPAEAAPDFNDADIPF